jgi:2-polyprenyl-3-methyl-5-hydroxy-6-metoxy-1,4-benzoquinol methylase
MNWVFGSWYREAAAFYPAKRFLEVERNEYLVHMMKRFKKCCNDIAEVYRNIKPNSIILDVGCEEGRNSIFLTEQGHKVDAFDLSEAGIEKVKSIAAAKGLNVNFFVCDLS